MSSVKKIIKNLHVLPKLTHSYFTVGLPSFTHTTVLLLQGRLAKRERPAASDREYLALYDQICDNLKPVMKHFFMEKFREPHLWLQARENYSKSVAVTSMGMFIMYLVF